jgi:transposase
MMRHNARITPEVRAHICYALDTEQMTRKEAERIFRIPYSTICDIFRKFNENGGEVQYPRGHVPKPHVLSQEHVHDLRVWIDGECTLTLRELQEKLQTFDHKLVSLETIRKATLSFNYSVKRITLKSERADLPKFWDLRLKFAKWFIRKEANATMKGRPHKILFFDESPFYVETRRRVGRALKGEKARVKVPRIKSKCVSIMACIGIRGMEHYKEARGNAENLKTFLKELFDKLPDTGYTIVLDNASFHHNKEVKALVKDRGHFLKYLPAYSPYLNPIECFFNEWKDYVRKHRPRSEIELQEAISTVDAKLTAHKARKYFRHVVNNCIKIVNGVRDDKKLK